MATSSTNSSADLLSVRLISITIEGFKSFKSRATVPLPAGFTCIAGANGAGKSNLLDAVCFALGDSPGRLRVKTLAELASAPNIRTFVELTIQQKQTTLRVASCIIDSTRFYCVDDNRVPKHRFDATLSSLGLLLGGSSVWRISQTEKKAELTPSDLHDCICEVSGTKLFNQRREDAFKQIAGAKLALAAVQTDLGKLRREAAVEMETIADDERMRELQDHLSETIPSEKRLLNWQLHSAESRLWATRLDGNEAELQSALASLSVVSSSAAAEEAIVSAEVATSSKSRAAAAVVVARRHKHQRTAAAELQDAKVRLQELIHCTAQCAAFKLTLRAVAVLLREYGQVRKPNLLRRRDTLRVTLRSAVARLAALEDFIVDDAEALAEARKDAECAASTARATVVRCTAAHSEAQARVLERLSERSAVSAEHSALEQRCATLSADISARWKVYSPTNDMFSPPPLTPDTIPFEEAALASLEDAARSLQHDVSRLHARSTALSVQLRCWLPEQQGGDHDDSAGNSRYLFELIEVNKEYICAIDCILASSLSVKVVATTAEALALATAARTAGRAVRIWAADRIDSPPGTLLQRRAATLGKILEKLGELPSSSKVIDPLTLLTWDETNETAGAAIAKALSNWVIVDSDETAEDVLGSARGQVRAVTLAGNIHAMGSVVGGWRGQDGTTTRLGSRATDGLRTSVANELRCCLIELARAQSYLRETENNVAGIREAVDKSWELKGFTVQLDSCQKRLVVATEEECSAKEEAQIAATHIQVAEEELARVQATVESLVGRLQSAEAASGEGERRSQIKRCLTQEHAAAESEAKGVEKAIADLDDELEMVRDRLQPELPDIEEKMRLAASEYEVGSGGGVESEGHLFRCPTTTMAVLCQALASLEKDIFVARNTLATAEASMAKVSQELQSEDALRSREHDARIKFQSLKEEMTGLECRIQFLKKEVTTCRDSRAKSLSKMESFRIDPDLPADTSGNYKSVEQLHSELDAAKAKENLHRNALRDLKHKISTAGRTFNGANIVNRGTIKTKASSVDMLQNQMQGIFEAIRHLEEGVEDAVSLMKSVNLACFHQVRTTFETHVSSLLPGKVGRLELLCEPELEGGIALTIYTVSSTSPWDAKSYGQQRSVKELSGGEKALVGLALTCALASFKQAPLYLLDEVDAPMDEHNQERAAEAVKACFRGSQVLCVSHHAALQQNSDQMLQLARDKGESSKYVRCVAN